LDSLAVGNKQKTTVGSVADIWPKVQTCGRKSGRFGRIPDFIRISNKVVFSEMQSL